MTQGSIDFVASSGMGTSPNTGTLFNVATLSGVTGSDVVGFDIYNVPGTGASSPGTAYLSTGSTFYTFDLNTGVATAVGNYTGILLVDFAVVPEPGTMTMACVGLAGAFVQARRRRRKTAVAV